MIKAVELYKKLFTNAIQDEWEDIENLLLFSIPPNVDKDWYQENITTPMIQFLKD